MVDRLEWSLKRVIALVIASGTTALILGLSGHRMLEPGSLPPIVWMAVFANVVQWIAYLCVTLRIGLHADMLKRVDRLREQIREETRTEVAKLLKPIDSKIEEIDADVHAYGDQRAAEGIQLGVKLVSQQGKNGRAHLYPVE